MSTIGAVDTRTLVQGVRPRTAISDDCRFCAIQQTEPTVLAAEAGSVVPSHGSLVEGWTLIVPTSHVLSLAELGDDDWNRFAKLVNDVRRLVVQEYGESVLFEHGSAGIGRPAGCGVDHAHLHVVPISLDIRRAVVALGADFATMSWEPAGERPQAPPGVDYIYISDQSGSWITFADSLPGQVIRRAIASHLRAPQWDWRADHHLEVSARTLNRLGRAA